MKLSLFRRLLRPVLTSLAGVAMIFGLASCRLSSLEVLSVFPGSANPGDQDLMIEVNSFVSGDAVIRFLNVVNLDDTPATDVTLTGFGGINPPHGGNDTTTTRMDVSLTAVPRVVLLKVTALIDNLENVQLSHTIPFVIGAPPLVTDVVVPGSRRAQRERMAGAAVPSVVLAIERGAAVPVEIVGTNFDATAQVIAEDPAVAISDVAFDGNSGNVFATVTTPLNGRTGRSRFYLQTDGGQSGYFEIAVRAPEGGGGGGKPVLTRLFPNPIASGTTTDVTITGQNLLGAVVRIIPPNPNPPISVATHVVDANTVVVTFIPDPVAQTTDVIFLADSPGGTSEPVIITIQAPGSTPPGGKLPRITAVAEDFLTAGIVTGKQLRITGTNLIGDQGQQFNMLYLLPSPTFPQKTANYAFFLPSDNLAVNDSVVVSLGIVPFTAGDPLISGVVNIALEWGDGFTTNAIELAIEAPPPPTDGRPFVESVSPVSVARGETNKQVLLTGVRLTDITSVVFDQPGITVTTITPTNGGLGATLVVSVAANAVLTGDAATNFQLNTGHGQSPKAGLIVTP